MVVLCKNGKDSKGNSNRLSITPVPQLPSSLSVIYIYFVLTKTHVEIYFHGVNVELWWKL